MSCEVVTEVILRNLRYSSIVSASCDCSSLPKIFVSRLMDSNLKISVEKFQKIVRRSDNVSRRIGLRWYRVDEPAGLETRGIWQRLNISRGCITNEAANLPGWKRYSHSFRAITVASNKTPELIESIDGDTHTRADGHVGEILDMDRTHSSKIGEIKVKRSFKIFDTSTNKSGSSKISIIQQTNLVDLVQISSLLRNIGSWEIKTFVKILSCSRINKLSDDSRIEGSIELIDHDAVKARQFLEQRRLRSSRSFLGWALKPVALEPGT